MTAEPEAPLLAPAQAAVLLDQVLQEQLLECVDLEAMHRLAQSLTLMLGDLEGVPCDRAGELARSLVDRAMRRLPDELLGYLAVASQPFQGCALCDDEAAQPRGCAG